MQKGRLPGLKNIFRMLYNNLCAFFFTSVSFPRINFSTVNKQIKGIPIFVFFKTQTSVL